MMWKSDYRVLMEVEDFRTSRGESVQQVGCRWSFPINTDKSVHLRGKNSLFNPACATGVAVLVDNPLNDLLKGFDVGR